MPVLTFLRPFVPALRRLIALTLVLVCVLAVGPAAPLFAPTAAGQSSPQMMLHITILEGEDSLNNIRERTAREPIVQVEDENHKPVAGALLLFSIQDGGSGAGGTFNGLSSLSVTTDAQGRGIAHGLRPNQTAGTYSISVTATLGALVATAVIHQSNVAGAGGTTGGAEAPAAPVTPGIPGAPIAPGAPVIQTAPTAETPSSNSGSSSAPVTKVRKGLRHIPKKVWITGATIVTAGVVAGVVVATRGNNSTTITAGTGTVGP